MAVNPENDGQGVISYQGVSAWSLCVEVTYICGMSAAEIIEQIKQLPPDEKQAVREFCIAEADKERAVPTLKYVDRKELERTSAEIFKKHERLFRKLAQ